MTLPSGKLAQATTNSKGKAVFWVPATEAESGEVTILIAGLGSWTAEYQRTSAVALGR